MLKVNIIYELNQMQNTLLQIGKQQKQQMIEWIKKATGRNITGNFKFHIRSEPQNFDTATTISVTAYSDKSQSAIVPCHYKWYRIRNGLTQESYKFRGNSYVCDSSDIGAIIQAQVTSNDPQFSGQANIQFGPIKLAPQIKKHLMQTLTNRSTFIRGFVCLNQYQQKECQFKIFQDMIKICHMQSELNFSFHYTSNQPRIQISPRDPTKLMIIFGQNYDMNQHAFMRNLFGPVYDQLKINTGSQFRIQLRFPAKQTRDIFLLTLRAFNTKQQLKNSAVIHRIQEANFNQKQDINLLFEIQSLRSDLTRLYYSNQQKQKDRSRLQTQVTRLQRQMEQIVTTYTRIAQQKFKNSRELNQSYAALTTKRDEVFGRKCQNLERENLNLNERIKLLTAEIDDIRINSSMAKRNQTVINPNFTHVTTIRMNPGNRVQATTFDNILEHLSESRVTDFNEESFTLSRKLDKANQQKVQLEKKLQKSFRMIDELQKKYKAQGMMLQNQSAIQFNMTKKDFVPKQINTSSYSLALDLEKLQKQNNKLAGINENLKKQNKNLHQQLSSASSRIIIKPIQQQQMPTQVQVPIQPPFQNSIDNMKVSVSRQNQLQMQNDALKKQIAALKQSIKNEEAKVERIMRDKIMLQRRVEELLKELEMYKKNQQVLNRSQHLSMEMDNYNQQQNRILREHNQMLLSENQKLTKAVEKYMMEAKENIKLRKQILLYKQKANQKLLNPEKSQVKSILSKSVFGQQSISHESHVIGRGNNVL